MILVRRHTALERPFLKCKLSPLLRFFWCLASVKKMGDPPNIFKASILLNTANLRHKNGTIAHTGVNKMEKKLITLYNKVT